MWAYSFPSLSPQSAGRLFRSSSRHTPLIPCYHQMFRCHISTRSAEFSLNNSEDVITYDNSHIFIMWWILSPSVNQKPCDCCLQQHKWHVCSRAQQHNTNSEVAHADWSCSHMIWFSVFMKETQRKHKSTPYPHPHLPPVKYNKVGGHGAGCSSHVKWERCSFELCAL